MARRRSTDTSGQSFQQSKVDQVWEKGAAAPGQDPKQWRKDHCGALIARNSYGGETQYGWEIDHIQPVSRNGSDDLGNLQPLHWENNRGKADSWPNWDCTRRS